MSVRIGSRLPRRLGATDVLGAAPKSPPRNGCRLPEALAATDALDRLHTRFSRTRRERRHAEHKPRQLFVPDALSNPAHWQFALKTTLAIMIVYSVYTMLDWPGLRTSIVTVFFVALGSLGKGTQVRRCASPERSSVG